MFPSISDNGEEIAVWNNFYSGDEFESAVSLISYLPDAKGENPEFTDDFEDESTFPVAMVVGGVLTAALGAMVILYLKKKPVP